MLKCHTKILMTKREKEIIKLKCLLKYVEITGVIFKILI